jgi:hypothetical protein
VGSPPALFACSWLAARGQRRHLAPDTAAAAAAAVPGGSTCSGAAAPAFTADISTGLPFSSTSCAGSTWFLVLSAVSNGTWRTRHTQAAVHDVHGTMLRATGSGRLMGITAAAAAAAAAAVAAAGYGLGAAANGGWSCPIDIAWTSC